MPNFLDNDIIQVSQLLTAHFYIQSNLLYEILNVISAEDETSRAKTADGGNNKKCLENHQSKNSLYIQFRLKRSVNIMRYKIKILK